MDPYHVIPALSEPSRPCAANLQVVAGVGLLLLSLGALAWEARHWLGITQEVCLCLQLLCLSVMCAAQVFFFGSADLHL